MSDYVLEKKKNFYFNLLCDRLSRINEEELLQVIKNSQFEVIVEYDTNNDYSNFYIGHLIKFILSAKSYLDILDKKNLYAEKIKDEFNKIYDISPVEFIDTVLFEPSDSEHVMNHNFFSSLNSFTPIMCNKLPSYSDTDLERIWGEKDLRIFISHRDSDKLIAHNLKEKLLKYNITSFVAHEDIKPTEAWVEEIMKALMSMDVCLCLLTDTFAASAWTNQEIGFALGRDIPIIPLKTNNINPTGFISHLQAKKYTHNDCAKDIITMLLERDSLSCVRNKAISCLTNVLSEVNTYAEAVTVANLCYSVKNLTEEQVERFVRIFNQNRQINGSYNVSGFDANGRERNSKRPFADWLSSATGEKYSIKNISGAVTIFKEI